jgi:LacI family transcriptional regulator
VLNKQETPVVISEATRKKVLEAARTLGYVPSAAARALRKGACRTIGILGNAPEIFLDSLRTVGLDTEMMRALMMEALHAQVHVLLLTGVVEDDHSYNNQLAEIGMVDGLVVYNRDLSAGGWFLDAIQNSGRPLVYLMEYPQEPAVCYFAPDDVQGGRLAAEMLLAAGHKRIGFLTENIYPGIFGRRRAGWAEALRQAGIMPADAWVLTQQTQLDARIVQSERLTALVCANQWLAFNFRAKTAKASGLAVPDDISLVAVTCESPNSRHSADLARAYSPLTDIVAAGTKALIELVSGKELAEQRHLFPFIEQPGVSVKALVES